MTGSARDKYMGCGLEKPSLPNSVLGVLCAKARVFRVQGSVAPGNAHGLPFPGTAIAI